MVRLAGIEPAACGLGIPENAFLPSFSELRQVPSSLAE